MTAQSDQVNGNRKCDDYTDGPQFGQSEGRLASDKTPELTDNKQSGQHQDPTVSACSKREKSSHQKQESRKRKPGSLPTEDKGRYNREPNDQPVRESSKRQREELQDQLKSSGLSDDFKNRVVKSKMVWCYQSCDETCQ